MNKFEKFYTGFLYCVIFIATLVCIFDPFWIIGEFFRWWLKETPFNWVCVLIELASLIALIITMTIAGAKTQRDIEELNPIAKKVKAINRTKITDYKQIKSQLDACAVLNRVAQPGQELKDIADAINFLDGDYKPNKSSWRPYFWWDEAGGFGFSGSSDVTWISFTGARLAFRFRTQAASDYFGNEFLPLHKQLFYS